eukprot:SAG11_NODE_1213_length_5506_cov_2.953579_2_plen_142_part_00
MDSTGAATPWSLWAAATAAGGLSLAAQCIACPDPDVDDDQAEQAEQLRRQARAAEAAASAKVSSAADAKAAASSDAPSCSSCVRGSGCAECFYSGVALTEVQRALVKELAVLRVRLLTASLSEVRTFAVEEGMDERRLDAA